MTKGSREVHESPAIGLAIRGARLVTFSASDSAGSFSLRVPGCSGLNTVETGWFVLEASYISQ
jgi:hypothetical protein